METICFIPSDIIIHAGIVANIIYSISACIMDSKTDGGMLLDKCDTCVKVGAF